MPIECNPNSTGSIIAVCYVFNILAAILIVTFCYQLNSVVRVVIMELFFIGGFLVLSTSGNSLPLLFAGAILIGVAISIFELTIPPMATMYQVQATNALASGAGIAQIVGSSLFVSAKALNIPDKYTFYPFLCVNITGIILFLCLIQPPSKDTVARDVSEMWSDNEELEIMPLIVGSGVREKPETVSTYRQRPPEQGKSNKPKLCCPKKQAALSSSILTQQSNWLSVFSADMVESFKEMKDVTGYLILVYFMEYYTNLGLLEHAAVSHSSASISSQYRIFMFAYHVTQSITRSVPLHQCMQNKLAILTLTQSAITACIFAHCLFPFIKWVPLIIGLVVLEGVLGSIAYLIGLRHARNCSQSEGVKKAATILVLTADVIALGIGSLAAMISHNYFCRHGYRKNQLLNAIPKVSLKSYH